MINAIDGSAAASRLTALSSPETGAKAGNQEATFGQWLQRSLEEVDALQQESDLEARQLVTGENKDVHGTMIAMQKASISFNLMMQIRNKVIAAYEEVNRMQL